MPAALARISQARGRHIFSFLNLYYVQVAIYRRLRIGRDGHLDQSKAYDIS